MYCQKCGAQNDDQAAFCDKCGTTLQRPPLGAGTGTAAPAYPVATEYAGFWRRFAASIIDGLIMAPINFLVQLPLGISPFSSGLQPDATIDDLISYLIRVGIAGAVTFVLTWLYYAFMESSKYQATLGKMVLGIVVTDMNGQRISFGRAVGRNLAKIVSQIILCIGYLMIAFTQKKQGLHDIMANCLVVAKK
jgi:uncharacterized RDD family membrane protein YckC